MDIAQSVAVRVMERCRHLAGFSENAGGTTRTFLSEPMHAVHETVGGWMRAAGCEVHVDAAGNLRGCYRSGNSSAPRLYIGSHLDTVPHAGAFDGILGVTLGIALLELLEHRPLPFHVEVVGFSEEEGVRFGVPFLGSLALVGQLGEDLLDHRDPSGKTVREAIRSFGLDPGGIAEAEMGGDAMGYLEFHIEQGPVLESLNLPLGIVETIVGQSRWEVDFRGKANHAGTTPMHLRQDALQGAAEWISAVEREAGTTNGLLATVGRLEVLPGAGNVIAESARASLDVRHAYDSIRKHAVAGMLELAEEIAARRDLAVSTELLLDQGAVAMDRSGTSALEAAVIAGGYPPHRMNSGAGHDAMIVARRMPAAMLFLRSPGGISHHPDESVLPGDVAAALSVGLKFLEQLERNHAR
jgi:allantoate deiminase